MKKNIIIFVILFELIIIIMTSGLGAQGKAYIPDIVSKNKLNYGSALKLYNDKQYKKAYAQFTNLINSSNDLLIRDYIIYYGAKSALSTNMYDEAIDLYSKLMTEYPRSSLYPFAEQYKALAEFYKDDYPISNFFNSNKQKWIKEFVGLKAMKETEDTNKAKLIALELTKKYINREALIYLNNNFEEEIYNFNNNIKYKAAVELYDAGYRTAALKYFNNLIELNAYKNNSIYYKARINQLAGNRESASTLFNEYLANTNNKEYRKLAIYWNANNYERLKNYTKARELYNTFLRNYPKDSYVPRIYNSFINISLNNNNLPEAKKYLTNSLKNFHNNRYTELSLKSYLRKALKLKNKTETYYAINELDKIYPKYRHDFVLSWYMWAAEELGDTETRDKYIMKSLLESKNPFYVKGALSLATDEMINNVSQSNTYYLNEAKKYYADSNYTQTMQMLDKMQFIDYIVTKKEDNLVKEARAIAKEIFMQNKFVQDFYSNKKENEIFNELSLQTREEVNKPILLYYYGDMDNAYREFNTVYQKTQVTYPLFYYAEKIYKSSLNTKRFMQICANIGKYFGYNYYDNVDLLPDEFRKYVYPRYFDEYVVPEAKYYKIEPNFVYSIMREESLFDVKAKSYVGAMGLMQLMPTTAAAENKKSRYRYNPLNLTDAKQNINIGISHLSWLFQSQNASNYALVAASYNAGSGRGNRWKKEYGTNNMYRTARFIDIEETEFYVERVMKSYEYYSRYYKN
ncbi:transglycosylase SLT domain-containing protein [Brachyspira pilosicoli]|uniref:Lytic transglycosylase domain-containing protein n=1 Tax=Brachyspira pilosicoli TaxID=52584 RepID=A0AAJ6KEA1_BRAPL|nr:transglycosylase SLT domain-containing protein [Brachyspira pilosicoli]WIH88600.1 lytic transglycosylase domain-containing protein [Brachyspira pilosicoli]WIH90794.1 lytic transglycosylase domain-containing protein [Brachyspira pilosicoli]WIH93085.1 lytic transglycosylase domain-containing protein [Brachyspira pilosicoli]WIH95374.1 lytic transglycosylase domain-containing protein [Brachyspira pilosicoli]